MIARGILRESLAVPSRAREVEEAVFPGVPTERQCWGGHRATRPSRPGSYGDGCGSRVGSPRESGSYELVSSFNIPCEVEQSLRHAVPDFAGGHPAGVCCRDFGTRRTNWKGGPFLCPSLRFGVGFGESAAECRRICGFCRRGDHIMCVYAPCLCFTYDPEIVVVPLSTPTVREVGQDAKRAIELHQGVQATLRASEAVDGAVVIPAAPAVGDGVNRVQEGLCFHE